MIEFNAYWTPVVTGETTFYETIILLTTVLIRG